MVETVGSGVVVELGAFELVMGGHLMGGVGVRLVTSELVVGIEVRAGVRNV